MRRPLIVIAVFFLLGSSFAWAWASRALRLVPVIYSPPFPSLRPAK